MPPKQPVSAPTVAPSAPVRSVLPFLAALGIFLVAFVILVPMASTAVAQDPPAPEGAPEAPSAPEAESSDAEAAPELVIPEAFEPADDPVSHANRFFERMTTDDWRASGELLVASLTLAGDEETAGLLDTRVGALRDRLGVPTGYELVRRQNFGSSTVRLVYIARHPRQPVRWELFYYRPTDADGWRLLNASTQGGFANLRGDG